MNQSDQVNPISGAGAGLLRLGAALLLVWISCISSAAFAQSDVLPQDEPPGATAEDSPDGVAEQASEPPLEKGTEKSAAIEPVPESLEEIRVVGRFAPEDSYRLRNASSVTRTNTPIFEIPSSVQVVPRQVVQEQAATTLSDTYKNVSGVFEGDPYTSQRNSEQPLIRGFRARSVYRNGFPLREVGPQDISAIDRVEIVKGPSSVLYGLMEPGGVVNMVMKKPSREAAYSIQQEFGSHAWYRTTVNATGPVLPDESLLYRVDFSYTTGDSFRDFVEQERTFVAPSLLWEPSGDTSVLLESSFSFQSNRYDSGLAFDFSGQPVAPINTFLGEPSLPKNQSRDFFGGVYVDHQATDWLALRGAFTVIDYNLKFRQLIPSTPTLEDPVDTVDEWNYDLEPERTSYGLVLDTISTFSLWGSDHVALVGVDLQRERFQNRVNIGIAPRIDRSILAPEYGPLPEPTFSLDTNVLSRVSWAGVYAQDQISLLDSGALKLLLAIRYDYVEQNVSQVGTSASEDERNSFDQFTYRGGLLYEVLEQWALYASAASSFLPPPNGTLTLNGDALAPETGFQVEVGTKLRLLDDQFHLTASLFQLDKDDVTIGDPVNPLFGINGGRQRSRGFELDFMGLISESWRVIGGYAFTDTEVLSSDILPEGEPFRGVPRNSGSAWIWYDPGEWSGVGDFGFGIGVEAMESRSGNDENSFRLPGFARLDAALSFQRAVSPGMVLRAQLNATNLTNVEYYENSATTATVKPGYPLRFIGTIALDF